MKQILTEEQTNMISELANQGYRQCEIAKQLGISAYMVRYWFAKIKDKDTDDVRAIKKCPTCKYRSRMCCEYLLLTGKRRNCSPYECDKYEKGTYKGGQGIDGYGYSLASRNRKAFNRLAYSQEDKGV